MLVEAETFLVWPEKCMIENQHLLRTVKWQQCDTLAGVLALL